jgi:hypothetical protein
MRNCNAKNKQRSRNQRSRSPLAQVAWLGLLLWALAPALWAQTPGTPFLAPGSIPARCGPGVVTFTVNVPSTQSGDQVVLINKATYPNYPPAPVSAGGWSYKFENITCTAPFSSTTPPPPPYCHHLP